MKSDDTVGFGSLEQHLGVLKKPVPKSAHKPSNHYQPEEIKSFGKDEGGTVSREIKNDFIKDKHIIENPFNKIKPNENDSMDFKSDDLDMIPDEREPIVVQPKKRQPGAQRGSEQIAQPPQRIQQKNFQKSRIMVIQPNL